MDGTRVFLVDDFAVTREGVRAVLECEPDLTVVGQWDVAEGAAEAILAARPDVAVLDVRLPDGSGIEVLREVHERNPHIKGLMLTSHDDGTAMFAAAMADLHRNSAPANRCSAWRRQIDVMQKASAVFARCTPQKARAGAMSQMQGSIDDFRAMIAQAQCP